MIVCAHYASSYLPLTENWIHKLLINHRQFEPVFFCRRRQNPNLFPIQTVISLDEFGPMSRVFHLLYFKAFGYFLFIKKACLERNVKILHVHFGYHGVKMLGLKNKLRIPMVCSFYGDDAFSNSNTQNQGYLDLFKRADLILVLGPVMKAQLINLGCNELKIKIHHLGIDLDKIEYKPRRGKQGDTIKFLIASSFVAKKGIDIALRALSKIEEHQRFTLDIIGDGPLKEEIIQLIQETGLVDRVNMHGYRSYDYFLNTASQCHVFIQASRTTEDNRKEGTPMAIADVMATGMPVIASRHSDIPEIVHDSVHGYLAEENNVESLLQCFKNILAFPEKLEEFGIQARLWIEQEFNAAKQTQKLESYYMELINRS